MVFTGSADEVFDTAIRKGILHPKFKGSAGGFIGETKLVKLSDDLLVIQYTSKGSSTTPWFTTREYTYAGNARRYLALPNYNTAEQITRYVGHIRNHRESVSSNR